MPKINKNFVDSLPLVEKGQKIYRDSELIGFAVRVTSRSKIYIVERRLEQKLYRVVIGPHTQYTATQAREQARRMFAKLGVKKAETVVQPPPNPSLADAFAVYLEDRKLKPLSVQTYTHCMSSFLPDWQKKPIFEIFRDDVERRHQELTAYSPSQANLTMQVFRAVYNHALVHYSTAEVPINLPNPVAILKAKQKWNRIKRRKGHLREVDLPVYWAAVLAYRDESSLRDDGTRDSARDLILFCMLTGCRRSEAEALRWDRVDIKRGLVIFPDTKNGEDHELPVGEFLWSMLKQRYARRHSEWVFASSRGKTGHLTSVAHALGTINQRAEVSIMLHDLRRTFSTLANALDMGQYTIKRLLNHTVDDVTAGYVQVFEWQLRAAMQRIEDIYQGKFKLS